MLRKFTWIGKTILKDFTSSEISDEQEKRKKLLYHHTILPKPAIKFENGERKNLLDGKTILLDFHLADNSFQFKLSDFDLDEKRRGEIFAFSLNAPKDKKKFLMTNNLTVFYSAVFKESLEYLDNKRNNKKTKQWFNENIDFEYDCFLKNILDNFYIKTKEDIYVLNWSKLIKSQKIIFEDMLKNLIISSKKDKDKDRFKNFHNLTINNLTTGNIIKTNIELWNRFINKHFFSRESATLKNLPSVFLVTFNGETILNYNNSQYAKSYINLCYYDLLCKYFIEKNKGEKICFSCGQHKEIIDEIPLTMKFYGTTNNLYFENVSSKNAYKSFALCESCLIEILTGMRHIENYFNEKLFDIDVYIIPEENTNPKLYKLIVRTLNKDKREYKNDLAEIKILLKHSHRMSFNFDFLFYHSPAGSQEFNILKLISNIDVLNLLEWFGKFDELSEQYKLNLIPSWNGNASLTFSDLRYYLFPSYLSLGKKPEFKMYGKELLNFIELFFNAQGFNYSYLIKNFIDIFKKRIHKNNYDILAAFKMVLFLTLFEKANMLKGGFMKEGDCLSEILHEDYKKFFETHKEIYGGNCFKQGLFLLGTVISKIIYAQKEKSSNFLKKLNFDGISPRRVPSLIGHVKEFANIYKIYEEEGIWGNIMDRLQGIENSSLKADEVVFYILTGISFADYLGIKKGIEKKLQEGGKNE